MKLIILSLSWMVVIVASEEAVANYENGFDGREAPTLKPTDYSDSIYQPGFAQNPPSRIFFRYKQQRTDRVPQVQAEKENIQHYFRVRKPIARRKVYHIKKESVGSVPLAKSDQVISESVIKTNSTPQEFIIKNDTPQDKEIDYVLDKLPELFEVRQESRILPLMQEINDKDNVTMTPTNGTVAIITGSPQETLLNTTVEPNTINNEKSEPDNEEETDKSKALLKLEKNSEDIEIIHIEQPSKEKTVMDTKYLETTTKVSSTPSIEILLLSNGGLSWEMNDTIDNVPKLFVEELIIVPDPSPSPIAEDKFTEESVTPNSEIQVQDKNELYNQSKVNLTKGTATDSYEPNHINLSPAITENPETSDDIRLGGIKGHLLLNSSNTTEESQPNVTIITMDENKRLKSPRRRLRRRKMKTTTVTNIGNILIEDLKSTETTPIQREDTDTSISTHIPITDLTTPPTTTLLRLEEEEIQTSTPRSRFTPNQNTKQKLRERHGTYRISNPIETTQKLVSTPNSDKVHHRFTTTTSPFKQYRAKTKFRKWNRNRNITPTVINPHVDLSQSPLVDTKIDILPSNITEYVENVSSLPRAVEENQVSANSSETIKANTDSPVIVNTSDQSKISTLNTTESSPTSSSPRRMRFRNKLRYIRTSTQPTVSTSTTGPTVEVISTTPTVANTENDTTVNQSTKKFKPPPPPPTLSPWYDGFGK